MSPSPAPSRSRTLENLANVRHDVLVVGGGIVGSGVARDAAMRGFATALVDRHDFAFGTSSRSSRLLHGGLRYLEQGRIGLVREASLEKRIVHEIAPHLCRPLGFVFPAYRKNGRPLWQLRVGVGLYDLLCNGRNFGPSRGFSRAEASELLPGLNSDGLLGAVRYFDGLTNDARLVLDTARSAARHGALAANYTRVLDAVPDGNGWLCRIEDTHTGTTFSVRTATIVNATGPWAQGFGASAVSLRLSKGIHLVVDRARLAVNEAVVVTEGKRILFVIPWGERLIVGTTDTDYTGAPEDVATGSNDIAYVLRTVNEVFPSVGLSATDIVGTWAGLRPLIANPDGSPSDISRKHLISQPKPGWWDVAGGKLTTYRLMAEQTVDAIVARLGGSRKRCRTAAEPLLPGADDAEHSRIVPAMPSREAVRHYVNEEWAVSLRDVMVRRSGWHHYFASSERNTEQIAAWMAEAAGWNADRLADELTAYAALRN